MTVQSPPRRVTFFADGWGDVQIDRMRARQLLQCEQEGLDRELAAGLPQQGRVGEETLGYCDVMNAGLYSGSGRSVAEIAERYLVRFGEQGRERWLDEQCWVLTLAHTCAQGCERVRTPSLPAQGSHVSVSRGWSHEDVAGSSRGWVLEVAVAGSEQTVECSRLRSLYENALGEFKDGTVRYQYLPRTLRRNPDVARELGVADCLTTALGLMRACRELQIPSRVRLGYLLGIMPIEHAWLEALDGELYKPLDPVLALLVGRSAAIDDPRGITDFCLGSLPNCLLPWPVGSSSPLHDCECDHPTAASSLTARQWTDGRDRRSSEAAQATEARS